MDKEENKVYEEEIEPNTAEPEVDEAAQEDAQSEIVQNLQEQVEQLQEKMLRQLAETENLRSRSTKLAEEAKDYSILNFSKDMVSVMDNLTRALEHLPSEMNSDTLNVVEGVKMTRDELASAFKKHSLESIEPQPGDKFDYHFHHAISQIVTNDYEPGTVVSTMQVGYKIKNRLIRPAAVTVSKKE
jgi:molecular chaperone GrpE